MASPSPSPVEKCELCLDHMGSDMKVGVVEHEVCSGCDTTWVKMTKTVTWWEMRRPLAPVTGEVPALVAMGEDDASSKKRSAPGGVKEEGKAKRQRQMNQFERVCVYDKIHRTLKIADVNEVTLQDRKAMLAQLEEEMTGTAFERFIPIIKDTLTSYLTRRKKDPTYKVAIGGKSEWAVVRDYSKTSNPTVNWEKCMPWLVRMAKKHGLDLIVYKRSVIASAMAGSGGAEAKAGDDTESEAEEPKPSDDDTGSSSSSDDDDDDAAPAAPAVVAPLAPPKVAPSVATAPAPKKDKVKKHGTPKKDKKKKNKQ